MKVIENEVLVACDVDNTIALWTNPTVAGPGKLPIVFAGKTVYLTPHTYHVDLLKMYRERGYHITVWSANGWRHAKRVVEALGLENVVDVVQTKLTKHMDDNSNASSILGPLVFEEDLTKPVQSISGCLIEYRQGDTDEDLILVNRKDLSGVLNGR